MVFSDVSNIRIYISDYYINISAWIFFILTLLSALLAVGVIGVFWWLKNLPGNLVKWRDNHNENKVVSGVFDIICALESENNDLAIRLYQKSNLKLIQHPFMNLLSWKIFALDARYNGGDIEKILLIMKEDNKTLVPAVKELISHKLKIADFVLANHYLLIIEKLSFRPNWFYQIKIMVCMATQRWDEALKISVNATKINLFNSTELQCLHALIYYMQAKFLLNQDLSSEAISILKSSLNLGHNSIESVILLVELLCMNNKRKEAVEVIAKGWKLNPSYQLIIKMHGMYEDLPIGKKFEEIEKLIAYNNSRDAYLQIAHYALDLNLLSKSRKYLDFVRNESDDLYRKLEAIYNLCVQNDGKTVQHYMQDLIL